MEGLIYAYHAPKSSGQRAYTEQRLAELAAEREQRKLSIASVEHIERARSLGSEPVELRNPRISFDGGGRVGGDFLRRPSLPLSSWSNRMETLVARTTTMRSNMSSSSLNSMHSSSGKVVRTMTEEQEHKMRSNPFELRHGRRYLRDVPYPLPVDLAEIQRQNLRTLLATTVFGGPICSPRWQTEVPKRVLEIGCGGAYWSSMAHEHFVQRGVKDVEFVGTDIAPVAPDLRKQGVNWKFVQHDARRLPLPFDDGEFDLVMIKDMSLVMAMGSHAERVLEGCVRLVKEGGTVEVWESDYILRSLLPDSPPPAPKRPRERELAEETATFPVPPGHDFVPAMNKHIVRANKWIGEALDRKKLHPTPCVRIAEMLLQEQDLTEFDQRRVAIPLGQLRWEKSAAARKKRISNGHDSPMSMDSRYDKGLSADQMALRQTALMTFLQMVESMEPMLREVSGKNSEEWNQWWTSMMSELLDPSGDALKGECLELGAWWGVKKPDDDI